MVNDEDSSRLDRVPEVGQRHLLVVQRTSKSGRRANELPKHSTASNPSSGTPSTSLKSFERDNQFASSITEITCYLLVNY